MKQTVTVTAVIDPQDIKKNVEMWKRNQRRRTVSTAKRTFERGFNSVADKLEVKRDH